MSRHTDAIAAISTPPGKGGVALIRLSGDGAFDIARKVFVTAGQYSFDKIEPRKQTYGYITESGEIIDDVLLTLFPAPNSYTGEDTAEICCHGGITVTAAVLSALLAAGARAAGPGEFTERAFINGKLTLTEAEAIGNLLDASGREQIRLNSHSSRARLNEKVDMIRHSLVRLMSSIYARIDYPDEDLGDFSDDELVKELESVISAAVALRDTYRTGRAISEGISTVICGKPNAGKSSLYNMLLGEDAAIVTDIEGTTRDVLERNAHIGKVTVKLFDTAGIRSSNVTDRVERIGIERSRKMLEKCELIFALFDISRPLDEEDEQIIRQLKNAHGTVVAVLTKTDLPTALDTDRIAERFNNVIKISTEREEDSIKAVKEITEMLFTDASLHIGRDAVISSARQHATLNRAIELMSIARDSLLGGFSQDAVSTDIERAISALGELDGREVNDMVVADIFSRFCVGK